MPVDAPANVSDTRLRDFVRIGRDQWQDLTKDLPVWAEPVFPHGHYECAFELPVPTDLPSLSDLNELLRNALRNHSGWPPFVVIDRPPYRPAPVRGAIETWMGPDTDGSYAQSDNSDFWRISPQGLMFTMRGYKEDAWPSLEPGTAFDLGLNIQRASEAVLQASYLANALRLSGNIRCGFRWSGLQGRKLVSMGERHRYLSMDYRSRDASFEVEGVIQIHAIPDGLPELMHPILRGLFENFDLYSLPKRVVEEEIAGLLQHSF